ncbi:unnamed protein product [Strongylus vulgaris]|uniref:Rab-GAP TBC domain-containing protein n=1 Tax=Strongylus vulgaris TaxID=40348 RepID=A0A3P7JYZ0_STRVU|nr:unnamed protein product [Strongylus vulgaris]
MPRVNPAPTKNGRVQALQRLAIQKEGERDQTRFERLRRLFSVGKSNGRNSPPADIDMEQLRKDCWMGIPHKLRPQAWRLLSVNIFAVAN